MTAGQGSQSSPGKDQGLRSQNPRVHAATHRRWCACKDAPHCRTSGFAPRHGCHRGPGRRGRRAQSPHRRTSARRADRHGSGKRYLESAWVVSRFMVPVTPHPGRCSCRKGDGSPLRHGQRPERRVRIRRTTAFRRWRTPSMVEGCTPPGKRPMRQPMTHRPDRFARRYSRSHPTDGAPMWTGGTDARLLVSLLRSACIGRSFTDTVIARFAAPRPRWAQALPLSGICFP
jgi:hypothetical protein